MAKNEDYYLKELEVSERGASGDGEIMIPKWIIVHLARLVGTNDQVYALSPRNPDPQSELRLFRQIARYADMIEREELKPIANRPRDFSENIIVVETE
jgi:hypothetical protein